MFPIDVTAEDLRAFIPNLLGRMHIEVLVQERAIRVPGEVNGEVGIKLDGLRSCLDFRHRQGAGSG